MQHKRHRTARISLLGLLVVGLWTLFAGEVLVVTRPLTEVDAIVSLASHEWERLPLAASVAVRYPRAVVLLTEPREVTQLNCHDCAHRIDRLRDAGVAPTRVRVLPLTLHGTRGEAVATLTFARASHVRRLLIVTSPYHARRALATFRSVFEGTGVQIGIEPASATSPARPSGWWWAPYDRAYVAYEWAAIVYYAWKYRIVAAG
jgi:uncharacterized SAM-binding protein YcdF (DUF218 family)